MNTKLLDQSIKTLESVRGALGSFAKADVDLTLGMLRQEKETAQPEQEPVAFLANGTRFKISYDSRQSGGQIHGIPPELGGRWVAFVAADDDCHLKLTTPPPVPKAHKRKPMTDEQLMIALLHVDAEAKRLPQGFRAFARAIEAAHGIKE